MKVAFEARALQKQGGGVRTYVSQLLAHLKMSDDVDIQVSDVKLGHDVLLPLWLNWQLPQAIQKIKPDVVHYTKAAIPQKKVAPTVVTIYDVIPILFPESQKPLARMLWPRMLRHAAQRSDQIITISEASKKDIVNQLQVSPEKITVTPLAVNERFVNSDSLLEPKSQITNNQSHPYILFVSTIEPRKNVPALVRAFAKISQEIPHKLIIAGKHYKGIDEVVFEVMQKKLEDRVEIKDFVEQKDLPGLYAGAELFVLPSIYEGWGFPAQEAAACGTPVIVSDGGSLPEVVSDAGFVVPFSTDNLQDRQNDTDFENRLADSMKEVLSSEEKQERMSQAGLVQAQKYSWPEIADQTVEVYNRLV